jgi:drug/metabolite transporter (DMT)-like permease
LNGDNQAQLVTSLTTANPPRQLHPWLGVSLLVLLTAIWGSTFLLVQRAERQISPELVNLGRFSLAALVLSPFLPRRRAMWLAAGELATWMFLGFATQAVGLRYTTADRSAFFTSMHVVIVPMLAAAAGRRVRWTVWLAAGLALAGCGLLSSDDRGPNAGDLWTLACAVAWAMYIYRLEGHTAQFADLPLAAGQLVGVTALCLVWTLATDRQELFGMTAARFPWVIIIYLGLAATAATTWLQTLGQRYVAAPQAAVLYTLEPLWAAAFGWVVAGELLGGRGWIGAAMIVAAALLSSKGGPMMNHTTRADGPA